jgi:uncharacterized membrane protein HdeD (DUF308 family)
MKNTVFQPYKLKTIDYYQIIISVLMIIFGIVILFRSMDMGIILPQILVGGGLLTFGIYRASFILRYFKNRGIWNRR